MPGKTRDGRKTAFKQILGESGAGISEDFCAQERSMTFDLLPASHPLQRESISITDENGEIVVATTTGKIGILGGSNAELAASCLRQGYFLSGYVEAVLPAGAATIRLRGILKESS